MGRREGRQTPMWLAGNELARSPGRFYEKLNELLAEAGFDRRVEQICASYFEADDKAGRPSIAPGGVLPDAVRRLLRRNTLGQAELRHLLSESRVRVDDITNKPLEK